MREGGELRGASVVTRESRTQGGRLAGQVALGAIGTAHEGRAEVMARVWRCHVAAEGRRDVGGLRTAMMMARRGGMAVAGEDGGEAGAEVDVEGGAVVHGTLDTDGWMAVLSQ